MGNRISGEIRMVWQVFCGIFWEDMAMRMILFDLVGSVWIVLDFIFGKFGIWRINSHSSAF